MTEAAGKAAQEPRGREHSGEPDGTVRGELEGCVTESPETESAETESPEKESPEKESPAMSLYRRRRIAHRAADRVLSRSGALGTVRERLALLDAAGDVYDLDESADIYGNGVVEALEERTAALLGMEAAAFFPTGTMAQQVALRCWAARTGNPAVALHALSHPEVHERDALSQLSGLRPVRLTSESRQPTADEVRGFPEPFGTLMLELPLRDAGFVLPSWEELTALTEAARERDAVVHFDGARLWESATHFGRTVGEIAALADSVYVSYYKSLDAYGGAAIAGPRTLVDDLRTWRHRYGGQLFQQFPTALSVLVGLERELPRLPGYVRHARVVAAALREGFAEAGVPWARVHPEVPHTHEFQVWLPYDADVVAEAAVRQGEETRTLLFARPWDRGGPGLAVTEVEVRAAGLEWTAQDVRRAVADFVARVTTVLGA